MNDPTPEGIVKQAQAELREETGFRAGKIEKLLDIYSHPGYIAHKVHLMVAHDLEWDPLEMEDGEEIKVHTGVNPCDQTSVQVKLCCSESRPPQIR